MSDVMIRSSSTALRLLEKAAPAREERVEFGLENEKVIHVKSLNIEFPYVAFYYTICVPYWHHSCISEELTIPYFPVLPFCYQLL